MNNLSLVRADPIRRLNTQVLIITLTY